MDRTQARQSEGWFNLIFAVLLVAASLVVWSIPSLRQHPSMAALTTVAVAAVATAAVLRIIFGPAPTRQKEKHTGPEPGDDFIGAVMMFHGAFAAFGFVLFIAIMSGSAWRVVTLCQGTSLAAGGAAGVAWLVALSGVIELVFVKGVESEALNEFVLRQALELENSPKKQGDR